MGIGSALARPLARGLEKRWVLLGTLLPDLIDKPLYYGLSLVTGRVGADIGLISCTRTFGHTGLLLALLVAASLRSRSRVLLALALGMATHGPLDIALDVLSGPGPSSAIVAFLFPLQGVGFAAMPYRSPIEHLGGLLDPAHLVSEVLGLALLFWGRGPWGDPRAR